MFDACGHIRLLFVCTAVPVPRTRELQTGGGSLESCGENIPPVETMPLQRVAARCPLCHEHRRYLPSEAFLGRLLHLMTRKPVRPADGRVEALRIKAKPT
jgi:hypothetical protein